MLPEVPRKAESLEMRTITEIKKRMAEILKRERRLYRKGAALAKNPPYTSDDKELAELHGEMHALRWVTKLPYNKLLPPENEK